LVALFELAQSLALPRMAPRHATISTAPTDPFGSSRAMTHAQRGNLRALLWPERCREKECTAYRLAQFLGEIMQRKILATLIVTLASTGAFAATGPSSSQSAYVTPTAAGVSVTSVISVGDAADNGYKMVGIPDGLGAYDNGNGTFTVLMNHELGATLGATRAHGATGAFVSEWVVRKSDFRVLSGNDLASSQMLWNQATGSYVAGTSSFARLCSADLPATSAFYNAATGLGTQSRLFMNGEETGNEGRAFAFAATGADKGKAYELPRLGKLSFENSLANPFSGDKTIVIGTDDSTPGQIYVYKGTKTNTGSDIDKAGLTNGSLFGVKVAGVASETGAINGGFSLEGVNWDQTGAALQTESNAKAITNFARPEDGHWADADTFYFVTTGATVAGASNSAKLYRMDLDANAEGGTISMVKDSATLTGTDGAAARSFDNMTVGEDGKIYVQEDPGNSSYIAKTWSYDPATNTWTQILESDRNRFLSGGASFLTQDEESSGIIEVTSILGKADGKRYFLADMQAHYGNGAELVEGGQLYMVAMPVPEPETYAMMLAGLGLIGAAARRSRKN
jgi:hypothetical protein